MLIALLGCSLLRRTLPAVLYRWALLLLLLPGLNLRCLIWRGRRKDVDFWWLSYLCIVINHQANGCSLIIVVAYGENIVRNKWL